MISNPKHGWCTFKLGDFVGTPSYLTDVPVDLLNAFIDYNTRGYGVAVFDEEGSDFILLLTNYNQSVFIIEEKDEAILHDFSDMSIDNLEKELLEDIEHDLVGWTYFMYGEEEELKLHRGEIRQKIVLLKDVM